MSDPVFIAVEPEKVLPFNVLSRYAVKGKGEERSQALITDRFTEVYYTEKGLVRPIHNPEILVGLLELNTWHNRCCEVKANDVAGLGFGFTSEVDKEVKEDEEIRAWFKDDSRHGKPIGKILVDAQKDYETISAMAIEVVRELYSGKGKPKLIAHLQAHTLRAHKEGNKFMQKRGVKERWFKRFGYKKDVHKDTGEEHELDTLNPDDRATEVIWDHGSSSRSDFYGLAAIIPAVGAVEGMRSLRDYNIEFFQNHGVPSYAIYVSGDYNLGKKKRTKLEDDGSGTIGEDYDPANPNHTSTNFEYVIISEIKRHLGTIAKNPHAPLIIAVPGQTPESKVDIEFQPLAVDIKEASFRLYRKDNRDEIIVAHGVPSYRIGLVETGSLGGSTAVESNRIYRDSVIKPRKEQLASLINVHLIREGFGNKNLTFYFNELDLFEETHEMEIAEFLFDRAALRPVDLMKIFGEQFDIELPDENDWPELYVYYINGRPVRGLVDETTSEVVKSALEMIKRG